MIRGSFVVLWRQGYDNRMDSVAAIITVTVIVMSNVFEDVPLSGVTSPISSLLLRSSSRSRSLSASSSSSSLSKSNSLFPSSLNFPSNSPSHAPTFGQSGSSAFST
eukprot:TRINITY_DN68123_c0_g1_i1.p1 TRINITY_DN68123_c0_g1~~TRINITY_DN68123_c0_g1_i1.p1  ORF type:complete len:106 (-),score=6.83 TRINITY_DN68123_c0_g1_i1:7-324(-)